MENSKKKSKKSEKKAALNSEQTQQSQDYLMAKFSEVYKERLEGHSGAVNSIDFLQPSIKQINEDEEEKSGNYLSKPQFCDQGLLLSASEDKTMAIWDLRLNKRIMMLSDPKEMTEEVVKDDHSVIGALQDKVVVFDIRKPSILLRQASYAGSISQEEINDIDINILSRSQIQIAVCDDTGQVYNAINSFFTDQEDKQELDDSAAHSLYSMESQQVLKNKHSNICFKNLFSKGSPNLLYSAAFDYKLVQWNLKDLKKSCSKSILEIVIQCLLNFGEQSLQYNPPFIYCMDTFTLRDQEFVTVGLGNGSVLNFKKKGLQLLIKQCTIFFIQYFQLDEIDADLHQDQISSLQVLVEAQLLVTASNDKSIALHRMNSEKGKLVEATVFRIGVEEKIQEIKVREQNFREIYVADLSNSISKLIIKE